MGLYTQGSSPSINPAVDYRRKSLDPAVDYRRKSLDLISMGDEMTDDGRKIDLGRDSVIDPTDIAEILKRKKKQKRVRRRLSTLLHTHVALITVCILSSMDAVCVIGQVICDILIMSDKLSAYDDLHEKASHVLLHMLPDYLNETEHEGWGFEKMIDYLEGQCSGCVHDGAITTHMEAHSAHSTAASHHILRGLTKSMMDSFTQTNMMGGVHHRSKRATGGDEHGDGGHDILHELTHSFHIGSLVILSILLTETFLKIFAMWKRLLHHKLEVFDAFVIVVSWSLDVAFWEGIWARPGQEGATLLIFILPWRVIRIVNSFVLVIQEKDLVLLKVVKQRLRSTLRREKESTAKLDKYRLEVRQLQGLCRKSGADESAIQACCPTGRRRRSSLFQSLTSLASVALVSAMGSSPDIEKTMVSSSSESDDESDTMSNNRHLPRMNSNESSTSVCFTLSPDPSDVISAGRNNTAFKFDDDAVAKFNQSVMVGEGLKTKL